MTHVERGKVWAALYLVIFTGRLWYVPNPREIGPGEGAPAVQIRRGAFELLRKCCSEPGTPRGSSLWV